jgi:hypothetical protein
VPPAKIFGFLYLSANGANQLVGPEVIPGRLLRVRQRRILPGDHVPTDCGKPAIVQRSQRIGRRNSLPFALEGTSYDSGQRIAICLNYKILFDSIATKAAFHLVFHATQPNTTQPKKT